MENIRHLLDTPHFKCVQGSITDPDLLKDTFKNAAGIFHQAAIALFPSFFAEIFVIIDFFEVERLLIR